MEEKTFQNIDNLSFDNPLKKEEDARLETQAALETKAAEIITPKKKLPVKFIVLIILGGIVLILLIAVLFMNLLNRGGSSSIMATPTPKADNSDIPIRIPERLKPRVNNIENHLKTNLELPQLSIDVTIGQ